MLHETDLHFPTKFFGMPSEVYKPGHDGLSAF